MTSIYSTPALSAVQFLSPIEQGRVWRMVENRAQRNPRFRNRLDAAKAKAKQDAIAYDEWICQQAADREAASMEDMPW